MRTRRGGASDTGTPRRGADTRRREPETAAYLARLRVRAEPGWWNRHTRVPQKHLPERACGFESRSRHPSGEVCSRNALAGSGCMLAGGPSPPGPPRSGTSPDERCRPGGPEGPPDLVTVHAVPARAPGPRHRTCAAGPSPLDLVTARAV